MKSKNIAFYCDNLFGFYTLKPIVDKYQSKKYEIFIYTRQNNIDILKEYLDNTTNTQVISIESLDDIFLRGMNYIFKKYFTNPKFTQMYYRQRRNDRENFYHKYIGKYFYIADENINNIYQKLFGIFKNRFKSKLLISISRVHSNYLVCSKSIKHISIMESWDHPVKTPYWHNPDFLLTWNKALKQDFQKYQNFKDTKISYITPLKFRYIQEREKENIDNLKNTLQNKEFIDDIGKIKNKQMVMYIATTSSINPLQHQGEMQLIEQLCEATKQLGRTLYVKPKPNSPSGDYDIFKEKYENAIVGAYATNSNSIDMLDEEYHTFRYLLLYYSNLIVNFGTTFVLESSLMDKPILQLDLSKEYYGEFGEYSTNLHIQKYLLKEHSFKVTSVHDIVKVMTTKKESFSAYSKNLKEWLNE
ncbi:hypothetical protein HOK00_10180 [bacterium]|nr:hypothetical protein [bacterium]